MGIRSFLLKRIFSPVFLKRIIDNIFMFSDLTVDLYFKSGDQERRQFFVKKSLESIGIGFRTGDPLQAEEWFIESVLTDIFCDSKAPVFFDIGANVGEYSSRLASNLSHSRIYSFEPNPMTFQALKENLFGFKNVEIFNSALSDKEESMLLFSYNLNQTSGHASLDKRVFSELYHRDDLVEFQVRSVTLDEFSKEQDLHRIDFIKIDTEGHELEVLRGGLRLLEEKRISIIQFEFNEMNIIKRVFLKDFFDLLSGYEFFRLSEGELVNISEYKSDFEIFWYQDIIAVLKTEKNVLDKLLKYQISSK